MELYTLQITPGRARKVSICRQFSCADTWRVVLREVNRTMPLQGEPTPCLSKALRAPQPVISLWFRQCDFAWF